MTYDAPELDAVDLKLLDRIQMDFPLVPEPYAEIGEALGVTEVDVLERMRRLRERRIIRQVSAIFDTRMLGYASSLVATRMDPSRLEEGAAVISRHPGVSHNYRRNHEFNLWYTIAVPPNSRFGLEKTVEILHRTSGAISTRLLPTLKLYKIGVVLDMTGERGATARQKPSYDESKRQEASPLSDMDIVLIRVLQEDLPVVKRPFDVWAEQAGVTIDELFTAARAFRECGRMRRFAAVLHHREAGFRANAMGVWHVPDEQAEEMGQRLASFAAVSHCYLRPTYSDWPYNLFTMVHGRTVEECQGILDAMAAETGIEERAALFSGKEYKKTRVRYFTPEAEAWESEALVT